MQILINASGYPQITQLAMGDIEREYRCEEQFNLGYIIESKRKLPVILSTITDPDGTVANTLSAHDVPVCYLAFEGDTPTNLSSSVYNLMGSHIMWSSIRNWLDIAFFEIQRRMQQTANVAIKRSIAFIGCKDSVGSHTLARQTAIEAAKHGKTLFIEGDYRFPQASYLLQLHDIKFNLENLLKNIEMGKGGIDQYFLHKSKVEKPTKGQQQVFKSLPDQLYALTPNGVSSILDFPSFNGDLQQMVTIVKKMLDMAKPHFDNIIVSLGADPDDAFNLACLQACDRRVYVTDTNPASVLMFSPRVEMIQKNGVPPEGSYVVLNKVSSKLASTEAIETNIPMKVNFKVPYDLEMVDKLNDLEFVETKKKASAFQTAIENMTNELFSIQAETKEKAVQQTEKRGLFGSLGFGKKPVQA